MATKLGDTNSGKASAGVRNTAPTSIALVLDAGKRRIPCLPPLPDSAIETTATYKFRNLLNPKKKHEQFNRLRAAHPKEGVKESEIGSD